MRIGLQLLCGLVLIFALAAWFVLEIFVEEIKPGVRSATEDTLVDMAQMLAPLALDDMQEGKMANGRLASAFARLNQSPINALIDGHLKQQAEYRIYVTDAKGRVVYDSDGVDLGKDYSRWNDVYLTLRGEYGARSTRSDPDDPASSVMHVAAPLREGDDILGSLTVAKPNSTLQPMIERSEDQLLKGAALLLFISLLIGALLVWWLNRAIGKLVHYADAISQGQPASLPRLYSPELDRLGHSLETMRRQLDGKAYIEAYVHSLTHELKSPLAAIRGAGEILAEAPPPDTSALNSQVVQAVQMSNSETAGYAPSQIAIAPNMMISQASGLVAQSAASYFDGVSKIALASQAILLRQMTQNIAENKLAQAAEDALGALATDLLMGAAAAVAAAAGAIEAESASFAIDKIDQSIAKYSETLASRGGKDTQS